MKARSRMCNSSSLKREFLKKWIRGLQICRNTTKKGASFMERKNAIKLSAEVAIAATRDANTQWRRAALNDVVSRSGSNKVLVEQILDDNRLEKSRLIACSRRILKRSHTVCRRGRRVVPKRVGGSCCSIGKKLVKSRRRALEKVVPGGEEMDGADLLQETLDYIVSLRVQVDVMRSVAAAAVAVAVAGAGAGERR